MQRNQRQSALLRRTYEEETSHECPFSQKASIPQHIKKKQGYSQPLIDIFALCPFHRLQWSCIHTKRRRITQRDCIWGCLGRPWSGTYVYGGRSRSSFIVVGSSLLWIMRECVDMCGKKGAEQRPIVLRTGGVCVRLFVTLYASVNLSVPSEVSIYVR